MKEFYNEKYLILCAIQSSGVIFKRVFECILRKPSSARKCIITSKFIKVMKNIFAAQVDQSILKVGVNLFGKVTTIRVVMNRRRPPISK